jgi:hypothetical protein
MKKLYKASYHVVIYAEFEDVLPIAECLSPFLLLDLESLKEIDSQEDLPPEWDTEYAPIIDREGNLDNKDIEQIFETIHEKTDPIREELGVLKSLFAEIQKRIEDLETKL